MTRIETFKNEDAWASGREYVALLQGLERNTKKQTVISGCMYFFGSTSDEARAKADSFVASEIRKAVEAEERIAAMAKRMRKAS